MIISNISRFILPVCNSYLRHSIRHTSTSVASSVKSFNRASHVTPQMEYIKTSLEGNVENWAEVKNKTLKLQGSMNDININGVLLKLMISSRNLDAANSFGNFLKKSGEELNLGAVNGLLSLYYELAKEGKLKDEEKKFILETYKSLHEKYETLDATTCEKLLHALCAIEEWEKAFKVLDEIHISSKPTFSAYNTLIATLFNLNKKKEALDLIDRSLRNQRALQHIAYEAWINYIVRKYKDKNKLVKCLDEVCIHISKNCSTVAEATAYLIRKTYAKLGWQARYTKIRKQDGQCVYCKANLDCLKLSEDEFHLLQANVKDKLIVGKDILLKTSNEELQKFLLFVEKTAPYDVVLDALNICYATGKFKLDKVAPLTYVIEHFKQHNKKVLLIGRKHMLKWPQMKHLLNKNCSFLTDNMSEDDPYFITAAILSGSHTDFVSKDLLRGHRFQLQDQQLRNLFQRWQWQHQWRVYITKNGSPFIQEPLAVTPCAQKSGTNWHIPFEREDHSNFGQLRDGAPDWNSWLCLQSVK